MALKREKQILAPQERLCKKSLMGDTNEHLKDLSKIFVNALKKKLE